MTEYEKDQKKKDRELKVVKKTKRPKKLVKLTMKTEYDEVRIDAIEQLRTLDAQAELAALAENGPDPQLRCEAACRLSDRAAAARIVSKEICEALAVPKLSSRYHWRAWLEALPDDDAAYAAYHAAENFRLEMCRELAAARPGAARRLLIEIEEKKWLEADEFNFR